MFFCLRIDLDYVPWDSPDAAEFGHGEPAWVLRLLELARHEGLKLHFFASTRALQAFPALADAVLGDGHELDWLCKHPAQASERFARARPAFTQAKHAPTGFALREPWPAGTPSFEGIDALRYMSAPPGECPSGLTFFPVETRGLRDALRSGLSFRTWSDQIREAIQSASHSGRPLTVVLRPQVMARQDPKLNHVLEWLADADRAGLPILTLRDALAHNSSQ